MSDTWDDEDRAIARALDAGSTPAGASAGSPNDDAPNDDAPNDDSSNDGEQPIDERLVDEYRDVLAHMPISEVRPRPELEDRIVAAALARRPATVPTLDRARARRDRRPRRLQVVALAVATVAAAVVIGVIVRNGPAPSSPSGHVSLATIQRDDIDALLHAPGTRTGALGSAGHVVVAPDGNGAVYGLAANEPVSIGLVSKAGTTVIGPATPKSGAVAFVVDHPERVTSVELLRNGSAIATVVLASH